jgi:hypothetical protein
MNPQELSSQAEKSYDAQDFRACAEQFRQAAESSTDEDFHPSSGVRNNVLRVILATQDKADHPLVDLAVVADALSMPAASDRNKGLFLLEALLRSMKPEALKAQRASLVRQLGPMLLANASLQQPVNREPAVLVLQQLSGEEYETAEQWKDWLARQPQ